MFEQHINTMALNVLLLSLLAISSQVFSASHCACVCVGIVIVCCYFAAVTIMIFVYQKRRVCAFIFNFHEEMINSL